MDKSTSGGSNPDITALRVDEDEGTGEKKSEAGAADGEQHFVRGAAVTKELENIVEKLEAGFDTNARAACAKARELFRVMYMQLKKNPIIYHLGCMYGITCFFLYSRYLLCTIHRKKVVFVLYLLPSRQTLTLFCIQFVQGPGCRREK